MSERELLELIERYHQHQVTSSERRALEERMAADPIFAQRVREVELFTAALQNHGRQKSLRDRLNQHHQAWQQENQKETTPPVLKRRTPVQVFMRRYAATMGVAATVAIVTVFSSLLGMEMWRSATKQQTARYVELRREVDDLKRKQNALLNTNPVTPKASTLNPGQFSGTGFVLTSDGYFVTSYHVIEGADSLMIENKNGTKLKVEEIYSDQVRDLALLRVTDTSFTGFGKLPYSFKQKESELGERVFTLGFPREDVVFGEGTLSSKSGVYGDTASYQISIPLNPGNSGGPLLDDRGNMIGVISGKMLGVDGAAFAVKSAYLLTLLDQLPEHRLPKPISLPKVNNLAGTPRPQQLKKLQDFVYMVKVYN
ncbi:S1 family peptidase [Rufibacter hautae]|uniref:Trypsin-like peptidase domain-containing protein n=1 Tax=Rufibacter hautae TaxID=2595005 RepID=A0A5B6TIT2_9BACT|nr:serine protease [Rufibacter hautae]KAA3439275.1 trypsin-like peptidase domain-containing protein [Rufibacter hautae]